ncbi:MAG: hypothetical protein ABI835_20610 [Chloroflexota bacterium]
MQSQTKSAAERIPTLEALRAMPKAERLYWLQKAAELAAPYYRSNSELTETADTIDLYDSTDSQTR